MNSKMTEEELKTRALRWFSEIEAFQARELVINAYMKEFAINKNQIRWEA